MERKEFLHMLVRGGGLALLSPHAIANAIKIDPPAIPDIVYRAVNGSPRENLGKVIEMLGGIGNLVGAEDIVIIKPNMQWWNQGAPNLAAIDTLVSLIMNRPGFTGEVIIAENCHRGGHPAESLYSGWAHEFERNSDITGITNMNALVSDLKIRYGNRYSTRHWIDSWAPAQNRVYGPGEGDGYVICDGSSGADMICLDNGVDSSSYRETIMSYPIFSTDNGTIVDYRYGEWERGAYTGRPLRIFNVAGLNHHSSYCGFTAAIKNYLGVADLSGGAGGDEGGYLSGDYCNFHSFPFSGNSSGPVSGMLGAEIGMFLNTIRKADLHIITAEWIGTQSRTEQPAIQTRTMLASTDPVALDAWAGRNLLYVHSNNELHNPENSASPCYAYLSACARNGGGVFELRLTQVETFDFKDQPTHTGQAGPEAFNLGQNYPNPFNASTTIGFTIARPSHARVIIYSLSGQPVAHLTDRFYPAGTYSIIWDGTMHGGHMAASGVYVYQLLTTHGINSKQMILLR